MFIDELEFIPFLEKRLELCYSVFSFIYNFLHFNFVCTIFFVFFIFEISLLLLLRIPLNSDPGQIRGVFLLDITLQGREARSVARVSHVTHVSSEMLDLVLISRPGTTYLGQVTFLLASCKNDLQKCLQNGPPMSSQ